MFDTFSILVGPTVGRKSMVEAFSTLGACFTDGEAKSVHYHLRCIDKAFSLVSKVLAVDHFIVVLIDPVYNSSFKWNSAFFVSGHRSSWAGGQEKVDDKILHGCFS